MEFALSQQLIDTINGKEQLPLFGSRILRMDIFVEQIVKKEATGKDWTLRIIIGIAMGVLAAISVFIFLIIPLFGLLLLFGVIWGGYYLITNTDCEYEYIVTNGEIDIDKIIAKRKRVRLITAKASSFEAFGEYENAPDTEGSVTTVSAVGSAEPDSGSRTYYADFKHPSAGNVRLIFSPNEKVIEAVTPFLPRQIKINMMKRDRQ